MTIAEIILAIATCISSAGNAVQFFSLRALRKKMKAEANGATDDVLYKRIVFLEDRVTKLEALACYDSDCRMRK